MPDPEILIRTGGFQRISDFFLFNISFTEFFFTKKLWPDFNTNDFSNILDKYKNAPYRAPMIVILITNLKEHPKVPYIEQKLSTAASGQNILNALEILGYSGIWRTGKLAFSSKLVDMLGLDSSMEIVGFLYIGTKEGESRKIPERKIEEFVTRWD